MSGGPKPRTRDEAVAALRAAIDELDEKTRLPGEEPLRRAVARQAREHLAEMGAPPSPSTNSPREPEDA